MIEDVLSMGQEKRIIIFGTGGASNKLVSSYPKLKIDYYVDNNKSKWGTYVSNCMVKAPDALLEEPKGEYFVIVASTYYNEISEQLKNMGLNENIDFFDYNNVNTLNRPDAKLISTITELYGVFNHFVFPDIKANSKRLELMGYLLGTGPSEALYIVYYLGKSLGLSGDICEFGVAQGATSALMANEIGETDKSLWLFDSFKGLPKPTEKDILIDDIFNLGDMEKYEGTMQCDVAEVIGRLTRLKFPMNRVNIVNGFIEDTINYSSLPEKVCFAYVDFDFYQPIKIALEYLHENLSVGGYTVVDDYGFFSAGAKSAVDEFLEQHQGDYDFILPYEFCGKFCILRKLR